MTAAADGLVVYFGGPTEEDVVVAAGDTDIAARHDDRPFFTAQIKLPRDTRFLRGADLGVHPLQMGALVAEWRELVRDEGLRSVLITNNPYFLDELDLDRDELWLTWERDKRRFTAADLAEIGRGVLSIGEAVSAIDPKTWCKGAK